MGRLRGITLPAWLGPPLVVLVSHTARATAQPLAPERAFFEIVSSIKRPLSPLPSLHLMKICQIEIENFRGIAHGTVTFPDHAVLFGPNNVGKSTVVEALALLFERERMVRPISDWDFRGGAPKPDSRIRIVGTVTGFGEPGQDEPHTFPKWFCEDAGRPVWWNPQTKTISVEADRPANTHLAVQVALSIRFEEEDCEFESVRYFYDGPCDPFTDPVRKVTSECIQQLGVFILPSNRQWEKLLSFGSSSLLKVLKSAGAIPGTKVEALKLELRSPDAKIEEASPFDEILSQAEDELKSFLMLEQEGHLAYRPTALDTLSVLQSLVPHVQRADGSLLPFARHGAGMVSLQAFLIVLAFAEQRRKQGKNFILAAEEPELHLHPALHRKLVNRIRSLSRQSVITTHSPVVAASYRPESALFVRNESGTMSVQALQTGSPPATDRVRKLYREKREALYEALMGAVLIIPEGETDYDWIRLWQRIAEASDAVAEKCSLSPIAVVPTQDSAVVDTFREINRFRPDALPVLDGDSEGGIYQTALAALALKPRRIVQYGTAAAVECLSAWIIEPCLADPGPVLKTLLADPAKRSLKDLQNALIAMKKDRYQRENLAWECADRPASALRAGEFIEDLSRVASTGTPKMPMWKKTTLASGTELFTASEIVRS
jgi:putative ATP-dependent endonuclease of OLD family